MNLYIETDKFWLPSLPPDQRAIALIAVPRLKTMPDFDPAMPVAVWAQNYLRFTADPVQTALLNAQTRRLILCCTRQWGKSSIAAIKALHLACRKPGSLILFTSASYVQSAELLRKLREFALLLTGAKCKGDGIHPASTVLPNGSRIIALPQSPATVRCYSSVDLIVIDEAAFVGDEMHDALSPMLAASDGELWLLSSPNGQTGEFHKIWTANDPAWHKYSVNALQCARISPDFLERERLARGETIFNREYMCQFAAGRKQAIDSQHIHEAFRGNYKPKRQIMQRTLYTFLGLDLGQRNDYSALAVIDLVEDIGAQRDPVTFAFHRTIKFCLRGVNRLPLGTPYTDMPAIVRESVVEPPPGHFGARPKSTLAVDAGGPGVPVIELLRQAKLECGILPAVITGGHLGAVLPGGMYSVPRQELVRLLRLSLETRALVFPADMPLKDELAAELGAIESSGGQSKHDDMAIAIALALWAANIRQPGLLQKRAA